MQLKWKICLGCRGMLREVRGLDWEGGGLVLERVGLGVQGAREVIGTTFCAELLILLLPPPV